MDTFFLLQAASSNDEPPVLNSLQKLLRGICDPRAMLEDDDDNEYESDGWESAELREIISNSPRSQKQTSLITPKGVEVYKQNATNTPETMDSSKAPTVDSFSPDSSSNDIASFDDQGNVEVVLSLPPKIQHIEVPTKVQIELSPSLSSKIEDIQEPTNQELRSSPSDAAINAMIERIDELIEPSPEEEIHPSNDEINAVIEHIQELINQKSSPTAELVDAEINDNVSIDTDVETNSETNTSISSAMDTETDELADVCASACTDVIVDVPVDVAGQSNNDTKIVIDNDIASNDDDYNDCIDGTIGEDIDANQKIDVEAVVDTQSDGVDKTQSDGVDQNTSSSVPPTDSDRTDSDIDLVVLRKMLVPVASRLSKTVEDTNEPEEVNNPPKEVAPPSSLEQSSRPLKNEPRCPITAAAIKRVLIITAINTVVNLVVMNAGTYCMGLCFPERQQVSTSNHRSTPRDS